MWDVLKRVAAGDMTAFVNIHSSHDAMGKNLYKLVQSNDMMFRNIVQAAHTVATGASEIADASHSLAESASTQADAVSRLSDNAKHTSELIEENNEKVIEAHEVTKKIKSGRQCGQPAYGIAHGIRGTYPRRCGTDLRGDQDH